MQSGRGRFFAILSFGIALAFNGYAGEILGRNGAVATVHPLATDAALGAFRQGGNAVDAAVAAALTLGVVDGHNSGIGGGCFFLVRTERGTLVAIDGRETAPAAATRDMFVRDGKAVPELSQTGALAIGIPGSLAVYDYALRHFGKLKLKDLLLPAAELAGNGFVVDRTYAARLRDAANELAKFDASKEIFFRNGKPCGPGARLKQPELAATYRAIADHGIEWFYQTEFPKKVGAWMKANGGIITAEDFRAYEVRIREVVRSRYRDYEIIGFPPPSSGGVHVAQILNILEQFPLRDYPAYSADSMHLIGEAMKLAFADRAFWLGDPDFAKVPRGLISNQYARQLASRIKMDQAIEVEKHGNADEFSTSFFGGHTTHFSTADARGNWVACTATVNTTFGSKVVIPGTGVVMNNQMDDFAAQPGVPNFFGLIGAEANAVEPGKRPLSSMSPTIVLKSGQPILSLGAAGGPTIISQTVINLVNILDYGMSVDEALRQPRFHQQWRPDELRTEKLPPGVVTELERRGHELNTVRSMGAAQIIGWNEDGFVGAHDPRLEGKAAGF